MTIETRASVWFVSLKVLEATFCVGWKQNVQLETLSVYGRPFEGVRSLPPQKKNPPKCGPAALSSLLTGLKALHVVTPKGLLLLTPQVPAV